MPRGKFRLFVLAGVLLAAAAHAQDDADEFQPGLYLGVTGSWGIQAFDLGLASRNDVGVDARVGYRAMRYLAGELQYTYFPGYVTRYGDLEMHELSVNAKGFLVNDNTGPIQPYLLAGVGGMFADRRFRGAPSGVRSGRDDGLMFRFGGGLDLSLSDHVAFVAETTYVLPIMDVKRLDHVAVNWGLEYRF